MSHFSACRERTLGLLFTVIFFIISLVFVTEFVRAAGWDIELGQEFTLTSQPALYVLARYNYKLADVRIIDSQLWLLPEAGIVFGAPAQGYIQLQALFDTPLVTLGAEARAGGVARGRLFARLSF